MEFPDDIFKLPKEIGGGEPKQQPTKGNQPVTNAKKETKKDNSMGIDPENANGNDPENMNGNETNKNKHNQ